MGRASRRKRQPPVAREKARRTPGKAWWNTPEAIGGAVLMVLVVAGLVVMNSLSRPAAAKPADSKHGEPTADSAYFQTTTGELSFDELKGSKVVLYFYEGVG